MAVVFGITLFGVLFHKFTDRRHLKKVLEHQKRKEHQMKSTQENIGNRLYNEIEKCVRHLNQIPNLDGLRLSRIKDNGGSYSIFVGIPDDSVGVGGGPGYTGHPVLGVSVNVLKDEITEGWGPYPNPDNNTFSEYDASERDVVRLVAQLPYRLESYILDRHLKKNLK